jgi:hypothetical protein
MIIVSVKVFLYFLIVDIISNCQTIIDNYTKNRGNVFEWNEYNFDDIDKLMYKKKSWRRVQNNCLKAKIVFQDS